MRTPVIAANWKMNLTIEEAAALAGHVVEVSAKVSDREIILFPSYLQIPAVAQVLKGSSIGLGGQNLYSQAKGAFTGETSAALLVETGCSHVLIGHSERREYFLEDYEAVNKKMHRALSHKLQVMLCVGESGEERGEGVTEMVVVDQLVSAFEKVAAKQLPNVYITYEPIWAIGTGNTVTIKDAVHVHEIIRKTLKRIYSEKVAQAMRVLYGGSVKPDNIEGFISEAEIDGVLVGGASLKAASFTSLINCKIPG